VTPCVRDHHEYLVESDVCDCGAEDYRHYHGTCRQCRYSRTFKYFPPPAMLGLTYEESVMHAKALLGAEARHQLAGMRV
jgi:hypothetical protein